MAEQLTAAIRPVPTKIEDRLLQYVRMVTSGSDRPLCASTIAEHLGVSRRTVNRSLAHLVAKGELERSGTGPATGYRSTSAFGWTRSPGQERGGGEEGAGLARKREAKPASEKQEPAEETHAAAA